MSSIDAITQSDAFVYTHDTTLTSPASGFQLLNSSGTLTITTPTNQNVPMYCTQGTIYNVAFVRISLNGTATGAITAFRAGIYRGTS